MTVGFVVTAYNERLSALSATLASIKAQSLSSSIVLVDDASTNPVNGSHFPDVEIIRLKQNQGICHARNAGLKALRNGAMVGVVNCDIVLPANWTRCLCAYLLEHECVGAVWTGLEHSTKTPLARWWLDCQETSAPLIEGPTDFAPGHAVLFRREALDLVAGYDEFRFRNINEDHDICRRMRAIGYETHGLVAPLIKSVQLLSLGEMARKDFCRMEIVHAHRGIKFQRALTKGGRRIIRHFRQRKYDLMPIDIAVSVSGCLQALK